MSKGGKHGGGKYVNRNDPRSTNIFEIMMNNWGPTFLNNRKIMYFTEFM